MPETCSEDLLLALAKHSMHGLARGNIRQSCLASKERLRICSAAVLSSTMASAYLARTVRLGQLGHPLGCIFYLKSNRHSCLESQNGAEILRKSEKTFPDRIRPLSLTSRGVRRLLVPFIGEPSWACRHGIQPTCMRCWTIYVTECSQAGERPKTQNL